MSSARILLAGGGTAGHVNPALATAAALVDLRAGLEPEFVGTAAGLEARLVPAAGWRLHTIAALPFRRRLSPELLRVPITVGASARRLRRLIAARQVAAACVFGGYVSGPLALAARRARIPLVVHEQNARPGLANRLAARWAQAVAVSVPDAAARFSRGRAEVRVTGNPVRADLAGADLAALRGEAQRAFALEADRATLLVFGGSLGAERLNRALLDSVGRWRQPDALQVLHVTGPRAYEQTRASWEALDGAAAPLVRCVPYVDRMALAYAAADLVLCRAGASTIAELTACGLPSVLVPYPHGAADEQAANAAALAAADAAVVVEDAALDGARLAEACEPVLTDAARRADMAAEARRLGRPDAAAQLAGLIVEVLEARR